eukprot:CAMPEP_0119013136 /NCGR_PEP_ID=MMETSP1176-20130426/7986_1 /TAXON_ID=265551 /ORGANISM="Synedropsis recta cf, Strain CCMP1620" /LENGTH=196 /DNA_ID=CAMNT_0006966191 /DNA_START=100 /DNA_END=690 /DNA_ORIENTATION=+
MMAVGSAFVPAFPTVTISISSCRTAFAPVCSSQKAALRCSTSLSMTESDFASAMPPKPEIPMKEKLQQTSKEYAESIRSNLGEGVDAPAELLALEAIDKDANEETCAARIYELMIEQGMLYDQDPETGTLTLTDYDIPSNLDIPEVKKEFSYLYTYGMNLIKSGLINIDTMKEIVKDRLIARTGLSPEEFDEWLGY